MKQSKKAIKTIIIILAISMGTAFVSLLFILHFAFPVKHSDSILNASKKYDIEVGLIRAVIWVESKYKNDAVSSQGAVGLMQLLPKTAEFAAELAGYSDFDAQKLYDESINIDLGTFYLRYLFDKFADEKTVLAAYNAGEGNVMEWQEKSLETIPFKETRDYIKRVLLIKSIYDFKTK